jgi:hypothetical protein
VSKLISSAERRHQVDLALGETRDALLAYNEGREDAAIKLPSFVEDHFRNFVNNKKLKPSLLVSSDGLVEKL